MEQLLIALRSGAQPAVPLVRFERDAALAMRDAGNVPDDHGRCLRLILHVGDIEALKRLDERRAAFEPDFRDAPSWRRAGSRPVNVVPLRLDTLSKDSVRALESWLDDPAMAELEKEWRATGLVAGLKVPPEYRSFVYKTIVSLRGSGLAITVDSVLASVARWLDPEGVATLRRALSDREVDG